MAPPPATVEATAARPGVAAYAAIAAVPGHVVVPEINITSYLADKPRFTPIKLRLAEAASGNIVRRPGGADAPPVS